MKCLAQSCRSHPGPRRERTGFPARGAAVRARAGGTAGHSGGVPDRWVASGIYGATRIPDDNAIGSLSVADDPDAKATIAFRKNVSRRRPCAADAGDTRSARPSRRCRVRINWSSGWRRLPGWTRKACSRSIAAPMPAPPWGARMPIGSTSSPPAPTCSRAPGCWVRTSWASRWSCMCAHPPIGIACWPPLMRPPNRCCAATAVPSSAFGAWVRPGWMRGWSMRRRWRRSARCRCSACSWSHWCSCCIAPGARLLAIVITLGLVVAIAMGLAALTGWAHTIVSSLVPLTVLVTATATLVYIHSRYIDRAAHRGSRRAPRAGAGQQVSALHGLDFRHRVGFAALAVSNIRPVREMGLWTASGLVVAWLASFTLFPALQQLLRTPTQSEVARGRPLVSGLRGPMAAAHARPCAGRWWAPRSPAWSPASSPWWAFPGTSGPCRCRPIR